MGYIILLIFSVVYSFFVCFMSQTICGDKLSGKKVKYFLPLSKKRYVAMIAVLFMMLFFSVFINIVYSNSIINNLKLLTLLAILFPAAYTDWREHIISNRLILIAICLRVVIFIVELISNIENALSGVYSALIAGGVIFVIGFLISLITKGGVGMGDVKLLAIMALYQGASGIICSLLLSLIIAFFYCIFALVTKKVTRKDIIPFAPFLLGGTYLSMILFGL